MPKKAPRNAFYFFMLDFKDKQQKKGINYGNLNEVAKAADPEWRNAPNSERVKYEERAKFEKQKSGGSVKKYTSTGVPLSFVEEQQKEQQRAIEEERQDISNMIKIKAFNLDNILDQDFYLMDVNYYCKADNEYVIAESTVLRFNLRNGFRDFYHEKVNPGRIPFGYASDVKLSCQELGLDMPDESTGPSNYMQILANIIDYLKQSDATSNTLPPLFTMPDKVASVNDFILQMCSKAGEEEVLFRVYRLDTMFYTLINSIKSRKDEGFPKESLALLQLKKDAFKYTPGLGCEHHESIDKSIECTTSKTKRWAYTILDSCCPIVGVEIKPGLHVPVDFDIEAILTYKDQKMERMLPSVAGFRQPSSCDTTLEDSFKVSHNSSFGTDMPRKEKRTYAPMRMPQADYSKDIRPAPELTEDHFPTLSVGAGRGRSLASSLNKLNISK